MSGAYTAKPEATTTQDYPPGWNPLWPFPGSLPPGFNWDNIDTSVEPPFEENDPEDRPDQSAGIIVFPWGGLATYEDEEDSGRDYYRDDFSSGDTNCFFVCLRGKPTTNVEITIGSDNNNEGIPDGASGVDYTTTLTFTPTNYNVPQKVFIHGKQDDIIDGDTDYNIIVGPSSGDDDYSGLYGHSVAVTNIETLNYIKVQIVNPSAAEDATTQVWLLVYTPTEEGVDAFNINNIGIIENTWYLSGTQIASDEGLSIPETSAKIPLLDNKLYVVFSTSSATPGHSGSFGGLKIYLYYEDVIMEYYFNNTEISYNSGYQPYMSWLVLDNSQSDILKKVTKVMQTFTI